jgi:uncharacterized short protein YbdD (DUF466 family)
VWAIVGRVAAVLRRVLGVPDYQAYLSHMRACHPGAPPLDEAAFASDALSRRYDRPGSRCC